MDESSKYISQFFEFSKFWTDDKQRYVEELFNSGKDSEQLNKECSSRLEYFDSIVNKISNLNDIKIIGKSLKIDLRPFKQALSSILYRWTRTFKVLEIFD